MARRVAVFVSGTGRHLENIAQLSADGKLDCEVGLVIANKAGIRALERAERFGLEALVLDPERALSRAEFSAQAFAAVERAGCELVVLAGFLRMLTIPDDWQDRTLNIHPSLLPAFGGKGFYGAHVHRAVLERGCEFTGCTVHYVDNEYDNGPILLQRVVPVQEGDTVDTLAARVFAEEELALPAAIERHFARRALAQGS